MSSTNQEPAGRPDSGLSYVPVAWLCISMALSAYGLTNSWRVIGDYGLPDSVVYLVYSGLIGGVVTILWGTYLLGLAVNRSARFPRHFTIWQVVTIIWLSARLAYVLIAPGFGFSAEGLVFSVGEIAIGVLCIYLLRRGAGAETIYANPETESLPVMVSILAALLGIILGGAIGAIAGFAAGWGIANNAAIS